MPGGRPRHFDNPEDMQEAIDKYFEKEGDRPTMSGLALELGMSRQSLCDYNKKDEFSDTIKLARQKVEHALEKHLYQGSVVGTIFNLKNNFGWKDKSEVDNTSSDGSMSPPDKIELVGVPVDHSDFEEPDEPAEDDDDYDSDWD